MHCDKYFELISGHIDGQNTPKQEQALQAHLSECADCRALLEAMTDTERQLIALKKDAPPTLKQNVMDAIAEQAALPQASAKASRRRWLGTGSAIGAVAAVLALMLGTGLIRLPQHSFIAGQTQEPSSFETQAHAEPEVSVYAYNRTPNDTDDGQSPVTAARNDPNEEAFSPAEPAETAAEPAKAPKEADAPPEPPTCAFDERAAEPPTLLTKQDVIVCAALSEHYTVPVLAFCGLDDSFPALLSELAPELGALLEDATLTEEDGRYLLETDVDTLFAIQEWFLLSLPEASEECETATEGKGAFVGDEEDDARMILRVQDYDPLFDCLATFITFTENLRLEALPEGWPEDFAALFRLEQNWALFYPDEEYQPVKGDPAYLVLIPIPEEDAQNALPILP